MPTHKEKNFSIFNALFCFNDQKGALRVLQWYATLIQKMEDLRQEAVEKFGSSEFNRMVDNFNMAYDGLKKNELQGAIVHAIRKEKDNV